MKEFQTSRRAGIQDILCPFDKMYITQGSGFADGNFSHKGTRAVDVSNGDGERAPYYAPFDCKVTSIIPDYGEAIWQSLEPVRFADGTVDYCSFTTCHDDTINYGVGYVAHQGEQIGNMGAKGPGVTGVHCHIEFAKGLQGLYQNEYGIWGMVNSCEIEEACFMNDTEILLGIADWRYLEDVPVTEDEFLNISPEADYRTVYNSTDLIPDNAVAKLNPKKYGGLSYKILEKYDNEVVKIETDMFGEVYISAKEQYFGTITNSPLYENGKY